MTQRRSRESQCDGKIRLPNKPAAKRMIRRIRSNPADRQQPRPGAKLNAYRCPWCEFWHVGNMVDGKQLPHRRR